MIQNCRKVLKSLQDLSNNTDVRFTFLGNSTLIVLQSDYNSGYDYSEYEGEIHSIIMQLAEDKYISYIDDNNFGLTERGMHPYQFQWEAFKDFLVKSIAVPIAVSIATTIITLLITSWLQRLL